MTSIDKLRAKVEELEVDLRHRDDQIKDLRQERSRAVDLVNEIREHLENSNAQIDSLIESFGMELKEDGLWHFEAAKLADAYSNLYEIHDKLARDWNKFADDYNRTIAPRGLGRPLEASEAQVKDVGRLRKAGNSLRAIAAQTGLGLRTVRTIVDKDAGTGRIGKRTNLLRKREIDRLRAAHNRAQKKTRDQLPKRIAETRKRGDELVKAAKGLDD